VLSRPTTNQPAHGCFRPIGPPSQPAPRQPPTTARPEPLMGGTRCPRQPRRDDARASSPSFCLWLTPKGKGGGERRPRHRRRGVPCAPAHPGRPHVPAAPPYLSLLRARPGAPNPNCARGAAPALPHGPPEEKWVKEEEEGGREAAAGEPLAAKTGAARGRSRTRRDRLLPLLPLPH
jgi:hypothetical protein